jgi:hypothetical protein
MTELRIAPHTVRRCEVIEIWEEGLFIGAIYPANRGVRIVSKYLQDQSYPVEQPFPGSLAITIWSGK